MLFCLDESFNLTVHTLDTLVLYDESGDEVETFEGSSCPCTIEMTARPVLAVKITAGAEKGFIMYGDSCICTTV